ncbi:MAG TPA: aminotransferase class I/II-fold pyridoxal phosphate-dependent enzyme [Ferruginibacter sp.]|nr:aminotransferase class I/II-fold pyridoxal phosphate-dependent enzyme [Ferruginibacter sp.]HRO17808.1 aminotransferase class I/II-fold pyridoxal phosphate-dependent enzyme [Ferruginibacter sp.]HRQ21243.1 aminotransferase class I/II-fold pyridoxal phosphate-dependent enzyme [Ferruginibacter sp.]
MSRVWLSSPHMGENERLYVEDAFKTNWVAPLGPNVDAFEKQLADRLNVKSVLSLSSGTAALHLALFILGVKHGDSVICQSFTFGASAFPIQYLGANPVFVDSEAETWNMDPVLLEKAIQEEVAKGKKPAAIIVVHLYGVPAKMDDILAIANRYQIPIVEDAAEALGSTYHNKPCGSLGTFGILSFNGNKIITTSGGGALASNDVALMEKARNLSAQAREPVPYYLHKSIGFNYRLSNVCAGIGRGQMEVLNERINRRREIYAFYQEALSDVPGVFFADEPQGVFCNRWLTTILLDPAFPDANERIRVELEKDQIETRALWKPLHQQPVFEKAVSYTEGVSDDLYARGLCLPSGSNLTEETLELVVTKFKKIANEVLR